eukprot:COSAG05_NODE_380_length_10564_cov_116.331676_1_plen_171_part_00
MSDIIFYDTAIMQGAIDAAKIHTRSAYKSYLSSYTQENDQGLQGWAGLEMMFNFLPVLEKELAKHKGLKIHVSALSLSKQTVGGQVVHDEGWATTPIQNILRPQELFPTLQETAEKLRGIITEQEQKGSGWQFQQIEVMELHVARYQPLGGAAAVSDIACESYTARSVAL